MIANSSKIFVVYNIVIVVFVSILIISFRAVISESQMSLTLCLQNALLESRYKKVIEPLQFDSCDIDCE